MQSDLLPRETPVLAGFEIAARCLPASEVGGDLARSGSFATLFHGQLDLAASTFRYVDGGHGHVVFRRADGSVEELQPWGLPLGVLSEEQYVEGVVTFAPGDLLVVYSDGLTDAVPELRNKQTLADRAGAGRGPLPDDLTIVALRRPPDAAGMIL